MSTEAYVYDAIRTPRGRGKANGALHGTKPIDLVVGLIHEVRRRFPGLDPAAIDDIVLGVVGPVGDQGSDIARIAAIAAGLPDTVAGVQENRFCASGPRSGQPGRREGAFRLGGPGARRRRRVDVAGADGLRRRRLVRRPDDQLRDRLRPQGIGADLIATIEGFSRRDVDEFAALSQERAAEAWKDGRFDRSVVPVQDRNGLTVLDHDEHLRPGTTAESLAGLKPSFATIGEMGGFDAVALQKYHWVEKIDHVHHAGNSSGIVDGAALVAIGSTRGRRALRADPAGPHRLRRRLRLRAHHHAHRPGARHPQGARQGRPDHRRHRPRRDQRGVRRPSCCASPGTWA